MGWPKAHGTVGSGGHPQQRERHFKAADAYVELAASGTPDDEAKVGAMDRAGYVAFESPRAKIRHFNKIWRNDDVRVHLCETWGFTHPDEPDPFAFGMRVLREHMEQRDERWGKPDRQTSLQATAQFLRVFVPNQTSKVDARSVIAHVQRPEEFSGEQPMEARHLLPAGQTIAPPPSVHTEPDQDDEDDDDEE